MNNVKEIIKNKYFLIAVVVVALIALIISFKKNSTEDITSPEEVEEIPLESNESIETGENTDLFYVLGYVQEYIDNLNNKTPIESTVEVDNSKDHINGANLTNAEKNLLGLTGDYYWQYQNGYWIAIKKAVPVVTPSTPSTQSKPSTQSTSKTFVTVVKYTTKNPPWNSTLSGIAKKYNMSLSKLLSFSENSKYRKNPNLIHVGDKVRVK